MNRHFIAQQKIFDKIRCRNDLQTIFVVIQSSFGNDEKKFYPNLI